MIDTLSMPVVDYTVEQELGEQAAPAAAQSNGQLVSELVSHLSKLGMEDTHVAKVISMLKSNHAEQAVSLQETTHIDRSQPLDGAAQSPGVALKAPQAAVTGSGKKTITICVAEEQQILNIAYQSYFSAHSGIDVLASSSDTSAQSLVDTARNFAPDVMLIGFKAIQRDTVEKLEILRDAFPKIGLVLLFAFHDEQGIAALREFSRDASAGRAYLLKHTIDSGEQLTQAITSVAEGRVIVDPSVMEALIGTGDAKSGVLKDLSPKALEVLSWVAKGYRNDTIAQVLSRDVKTVERHINNIYNTLLGADDELGHPRVRAALMYLKANGLLSTEQPFES
jgi:DNA-binding NarL/FixJ family response regulator